MHRSTANFPLPTPLSRPPLPSPALTFPSPSLPFPIPSHVIAPLNVPRPLPYLTCTHVAAAFYHGYLYELAGGRLAGSGHLALSWLLRQAPIDVILSPYAYSPASRNVTMPLLPHGPFDSAALHGKLHVIEDDSRTAFCGGPTTDPGCHSDGIVATSTIADTVSKAQANMLTAAAHGLGLYFYDIPGDGWYGRVSRPNATSRFWSAVARMRARWPLLTPPTDTRRTRDNLRGTNAQSSDGVSNQASHERARRPPESAMPQPKPSARLRQTAPPPLEPEIALVIDDASCAHLLLGGHPGAQCTDRPTPASSTSNLSAVRAGFFAGCGLAEALVRQPAHVLPWVGAPFRQYLLSDLLLPNFPSSALKLIVFANALRLPAGVEAAIASKFANKTLLFVWAPGVVDAVSGNIDASAPRRLVGLGLANTTAEGADTLRVAIDNATLCKGICHPSGNDALPMDFGPAYPVTPRFAATTPPASSSSSSSISSIRKRRSSSSSIITASDGKGEGVLCGAVESVEVLGRYADKAALPALVRAKAARCTIVFSGAPGLPAWLYRTLASHAGVHLLLRGPGSEDISVDVARDGAVLLHCGRGAGTCGGKGVLLVLPHVVAGVRFDSLESGIPTVPACTDCAEVTVPVFGSGRVLLVWINH